MDEANYELARYFADKGCVVHLVAHRTADDLASHPRVSVHPVPKLAGSDFLSQPLLNQMGRRIAREVAGRGGRVIVSGGNCDWDDVNWVHHVHMVFDPSVVAGWARRLKDRLRRRVDLAGERRVVPRARVVITQSELNKRCMVEGFGIPAERIHTIYLGINPDIFRPPGDDERIAARARLGAARGKPLVAFVGALGDNRKGFDTLFEAWGRLCERPDWDADLVVIGRGRDVPLWKARAAQDGIGQRVKFLEFDSDERFVARVLWACDLLALPSRYEGYGRPVQEALCCGVPALVSERSGAAEHYTADVKELLIPDPEDTADVAARLMRWRLVMEQWREKVQPLSAILRSHTWQKMAQQMWEVIDQTDGNDTMVREAS